MNAVHRGWEICFWFKIAVVNVLTWSCKFLACCVQSDDCVQPADANDTAGLQGSWCISFSWCSWEGIHDSYAP